ncbi:VOC family protein [Rhodococcus fascians]|nr:VOC family protein [Rhodococcus fascians]MBY3996623.1 VOC family protein [Rhodococcus fascians]MBY4003230.1 VOC family protein [Rhodococcus fascians]MBY4007980.1 VOC family protein [Rhodococcus fascians]MBY4018135.1 VOC family protein [Rhodococcus fascians]
MTTIDLARAPFSGFAVDDLPAARTFYADTLGLEVTENEMGMLELHLGAATVLIYPRPGHVPAQYTILNFPVTDIEATVDALIAKGVVFQQYPDMGTDEKGVFRHGGPLIAWFTDPAGNVLSVLQD